MKYLWKNHVFLIKIVSFLDSIKLFDEYYNIKANSTTLAWFSQIEYFSKHIILSILISKKDILQFNSSRNVFAPDMSKMLFLDKLYSNHSPKNWLIWNFNYRFGSKIIFSEVRLVIKFEPIIRKGNYFQDNKKWVFDVWN